MKESEIQKSIVTHLSTIAQQNNFLFFSIPNEGFMAAAMMFGIDSTSISKMNTHYKKLGMVPGIPDLCIIYRGSESVYGNDAFLINFTVPKTLFIEVKRPGEDLKKHQRIIHEVIKKVGHDVETVHGLDDVVELLRVYGVVR